MPKEEATRRRDKKAQEQKYGMRRSGDSVKTLRNIILRKAEKAAKERDKKRN